jgi:hypothetical protein
MGITPQKRALNNYWKRLDQRGDGPDSRYLGSMPTASSSGRSQKGSPAMARFGTDSS